jgi:cold shock CspA family protein
VYGQVKFWIAEAAWGLIRDPETNQEYHVHISDIAGRTALERNTWVCFDIGSRRRRGKGTSAVNVAPIDCPPQYLLRGCVVSFVKDKGFGFIRHGRESVFFHINDFMLADGVRQVPCVGCEVSFYLGRKVNEQIAAGIWVEEWPAEPTIEEYFADSEDLPLDVPESVVVPQSSVLSPATKHLSLIQIMNRQRREGRA